MRSCRSFWDETAVVVDVYPRQVRRAIYAFVGIAPIIPGYLLGAALPGACAVKWGIVLTGIALPFFGLLTYRPLGAFARTVSAWLSSLVAGLLLATLWGMLTPS